MRRSKDYYRNRRLLKELQYEKQKFRPTIQDIEEWFVILNQQLFSCKLQFFGDVQIKRHRNVYALFHYWKKKENKPNKLTMNRIFANKKTFVEILAHEMIHLFQYTFGEPIGHGPSFWAWRDRFENKGLKLYKVA